jgi:putative PIN family toxin of toxin-antitoxin system
MLRVVLDTSTVVSGIITISGVSAEVIDLLVEQRRFQAVFSDEILREYEDVLRRPRLRLHAKVVTSLLSFFETYGLKVAPQNLVQVIAADPSDNKFLAAVKEAGADCIVSGDKHLLSLGKFEDIPILNSRQFLQMMHAAETRTG